MKMLCPFIIIVVAGSCWFREIVYYYKIHKAS